MTPLLYRPKTACRDLGFGHDQFWKYVRQGLIDPPTKVGRMSYWSAAQIQEAAARILASGQKIKLKNKTPPNLD